MRNIKYRLILSIILCSTLVFIVGCEKSIFSGSKTNNSNQFLMDFDVLNTTVNGSMPLLKGDIVETYVNIKKGNIDIIVVNENGVIAYEGYDVKSCNLMIEIKESGKYDLFVTGYNAEGCVHFKKIRV